MRYIDFNTVLAVETLVCQLWIFNLILKVHSVVPILMSTQVWLSSFRIPYKMFVCIKTSCI